MREGGDAGELPHRIFRAKGAREQFAGGIVGVTATKASVGVTVDAAQSTGVIGADIDALQTAAGGPLSRVLSEQEGAAAETL